MAKQKARLKDIAEKTGYGTNTVSLALRGSTRISAAAREKIAKAALELEYVPNQIAKSLVSRRSNTVGLILHEITNPILTSAAEKIQLTLASSGYGVLFATSNGNFEAELRAIEMFRSRMIDGLLIYPLLHSKLDHLKRLRAQNFPVVLLVGIEDSGIDAVGVDEYAGAYDATRHLIEEGHRRIAALVTPQYQTALKYDGYTAAMASAGLPIDRQIVGSCLTHSIEGGIEAMERIMRVPEAPTAVFASSDVLALGALRWASIHGRSVPGELAIIGFDDVESARHAVTPLSTINSDVDELAHRSVARLMELIDARGPLPPPRTSLLHGRLMIRESTKAKPPGGAAAKLGKAAASRSAEDDSAPAKKRRASLDLD
jgi:LacI family transcriptional regulator